MNQLTNSWLSILCGMIKGVTRAIVLSPAPDGVSYTRTAFWPEGTDDNDIQQFSHAIKTALSKKQCVLLRHTATGQEAGEPLDILACPIFLDEHIHGIVVVQTTGLAPAKQQTAIRQIEEASHWFEAIVKQCSSTEKGQLITIMELVASCLEHERFQAAATDVMTDLATRLAFDRVGIGFLRAQTVQVEAVSHSAGFDSRSSLIRHISEAMQEAMDQNRTIIYPEPDDAVPLLTRCHAALADEHGVDTIITVPFAVHGRISGAILAESSSKGAFDQTTTELFEHIVSMTGPLLESRYRNEQWLPQRLRSSIKGSLIKLLGPGHIGLKLGLAAVLLCLALLSVISTDYRIPSPARLEALTQRVVVAPQDGYIATANVRPGDLVGSGDILATLDDKDLKLELRKWSSQLEQLETEYRDALARHDRSKVSIINARKLKAAAQLHLIREQLARTRFTAPFGGLIVSGDLSQALGSPVERGQVLFTVAPLNAYRVLLRVDERDIGRVKKGQKGELVLSAMPRKPLLFTVEKITPVSIVEQGRNYFLVEAGLEKNSDLLRPGMEGVGKINIERRKLVWIWSHRLVDWLRLTFWAWWP